MTNTAISFSWRNPMAMAAGRQIMGRNISFKISGKQNGNGKPGQDKRQKNHSGNDRKNAQNHGRQNGQNNQNNQNRKKPEPRDGYTLQELMNKWKI